MAEIKSALEKALEKADQLGSPSEEERLEWKWGPVGRRLAAACLNGEGDLLAELGKHGDSERQYIVRGAMNVFIENIRLPKSEALHHSNELAMKALRHLKQNTQGLEEIIGRVQYVCDQYLQYGAQQRQQAYQELKQSLQSQLEEAVRRQSGGVEPIEVDVEATPQFQEHWMRISAQLDQQYEQHLEGFRKQIRQLR